MLHEDWKYNTSLLFLLSLMAKYKESLNLLTEFTL